MNILLKDIDPYQLLEKQYNSKLQNCVGRYSSKPFDDKKQTKVEGVEKLIDYDKNEIVNYINMYNLLGEKIPEYTNFPCWYCRERFNNKTLSCPLKVYEKGKSKENILNKDDDEYIYSEGIMCSFPCIKSYIIDEYSKSKSIMYKNALTNLTLMYHKMTGKSEPVNTSGSWKLLNKWGGKFTAEEYRENNNINKTNYIETDNYKKVTFIPLGKCIREFST